MGEVFIKYKVVNASSLIYRDKPSLKGAIKGYLKKGDVVTIVKGWSKYANKITWLKLKSNDNRYYVSARYLQRITPNYLELVAYNADKIYGEIVNLGCKHEYGVSNYEGLIKKKLVTCATAVSIVMQLSGMMDEGKLINHTKPVKFPLIKKMTIPQVMTGRQNIKEDTYKISRVAKNFSSLPAKYKKRGAIYVYDSNLGIYAGDNAIYSCNNAPSQLKDGKYIKNKMTSGYCFTEPILYVILPND